MANPKYAKRRKKEENTRRRTTRNNAVAPRGDEAAVTARGANDA